ncbi:MAG: cytochrome c5 family protein [Chromatiales bacterium]|nr:cytochrome c5 family protein [Chromatiales bacterium]
MSTQPHTAGPSQDQDHDQQFFNLFMVVIGALIGVTIFLIFLARSIATDSQLAWVKEDPAYATAVAERIKPAGQVTLPGDEAAAGAVAMAVPEAAAPVAAKLTGEQVYNTACFACHGAGVGGAPKLGDAAAWKPRVAQGVATLNKHALEGFQGQAGVMPAKGGRVDLSDDEIIAAVRFMSGG